MAYTGTPLWRYCCCFLTLTLVKKSRVRGHTKKGAGALGRSEKPSEIKIRPVNTTLSRLKTHDTEKGAQVNMYIYLVYYKSRNTLQL